MNWIRIATKMKGDPRVGAIAADCKIRIEHAVGLVACTLMEFPDHARNGDIGAVPDVVLEQWALWSGKAGVFATAFRTHLCDETGAVRSWEKHNGKAMRKAESDIERKRLAREQRENGAKTARAESAPSARQNAARRQNGQVDETRRNELRSVGKPTDRSTGEPEAGGESYMADAVLLTKAANAGLDEVYPKRRPFVAFDARPQQMAADLRKAGVDIEWAAATIFHYARSLNRNEPPGSLAWFERFVHECWQQHLAKQDAASYKPAHDGSAPAVSSEVDQLHAFAIQYAREGKAEWITYCDERHIAWRAA